MKKTAEEKEVLSNKYLIGFDWDDDNAKQCAKAAYIDALEDQEQHTAQLIEALEEAKLQIEYLHYKFNETGSGNSVLSRIETALKNAKS